MPQRRGITRITMRFVIGCMACALVLLMASCGGSDSGTTSDGVPPTRTLPPVTATPTPVLPTPTATPPDLPDASSLRVTPLPETEVDGLGVTLEAMLDRTLGDLVAREVAPGDIRLLTLEQTEWTEDSWGCASVDAAPDLSPDAVFPLPGYRIVYSAGAEVYAYHTTRDGVFFVCEDADWLTARGTPLAPDPIADSMVEMARTDALKRLDATPDTLQLASLVSVTWPDASVGCPKPSAIYDTRITPGYWLVFRAGDATAIYHTSVRDVVFCQPEEEILPGLLREVLAEPASES